jgi:HEAT repeat protein
MRNELHRWMTETHDLGFLPEAEAWQRCAGTTPCDIANDARRHPQQKLIEAASLVGRGDSALTELTQLLKDSDSAVRYWAAVGLAALAEKAAPARSALATAMEDPSLTVRIESANALARSGDVAQALSVLIQGLESKDPNEVLHAARTIELHGAQAQAAVPAMQAALKRASAGGDRNMFIQFTCEAFLKAQAKP